MISSRLLGLTGAAPAVTGDRIELAYVGQGHTGEEAAEAVLEHGIDLEVVKLPGAKRCLVLLPRRWVVGEAHRRWAETYDTTETRGSPEYPA